MRQRAWVGVALLKIASLYLLVGLALGMAMALQKDFSLVSVHSHVLLLGWATLAITGIVYLVLPRCAESRLAAAHFWLHNLGLPVMMVSLAAVTQGLPRAEPLIGLGSTLVTAGLGLFTLNVLRGATAGNADAG
jgi:heme/copper-type cytochrome/quinol oxidase subunit 1